MINSKTFSGIMVNELIKVDQLFIMKNKQYASKDDVLKAFKESAKRQHGELTKAGAFKACMQFKDKHDLALLQHGTLLPDAKERLRDVIVYCLLGLAILSNEDTELQG